MSSDEEVMINSRDALWMLGLFAVGAVLGALTLDNRGRRGMARWEWMTAWIFFWPFLAPVLIWDSIKKWYLGQGQ